MDYSILKKQIAKNYTKDLAWNLEDYTRVIKYFMESYEKYRGVSHCFISNDNMQHILQALPYSDCEGSNNIDYDVTDYIDGEMIDNYFQTTFKDGCDYSIFHFLSVRQNRYYECCYSGKWFNSKKRKSNSKG